MRPRFLLDEHVNVHPFVNTLGAFDKARQSPALSVFVFRPALVYNGWRRICAYG